MRLRQGALLSLFGVATFACYLSVPQPEYPNSGDNLWYIPTALSILQDGDIDLREFRDAVGQLPPEEVWIPDIQQDRRLDAVDDRYYGVFPIGTALVSIPFVWGRTLLDPPAGHDNLMRYCSELASQLAAFFAALSVVVLMSIVLLLNGTKRQAAGLGAVFAFATPHFSTHASALWSHNPAVTLLLLAILLLCCCEGRRAWLSALPLALGYIVRPEMAIGIVVFGLYVFVRHPKQLVRFALLGGLIAAGFVWFSTATYGTLVPPYYLASRLSGARFWTALPGHIISPSRGLIVFAPLFLFSAAGMVRVFAKPDTFHSVYRYLAVLPVVHWFAISLFERWWAGHSYGPRLFSLVIPVLVLLLLPAWSTMQRLKPGPRNLLTAVLCLSVAWGLFVQVRGVGSRAVHAWNAQEPNVDLNPGKVWDWKNMQIFADPAAPR